MRLIAPVPGTTESALELPTVGASPVKANVALFGNTSADSLHTARVKDTHCSVVTVNAPGFFVETSSASVETEVEAPPVPEAG